MRRVALQSRIKSRLKIFLSPVSFRLFVFVFTALFALASVAWGWEIEWIRQFGGVEPASDIVKAVDADGNVYVAGFTSGTFPGQTSTGPRDVFVRKYDHSGAELWTRQFGTASFDEATGISVDATGVYVAGYTSGALPGQTGAGGADAFVRKYDHGGAELWTRQFGTASSDLAYGISVDATGVYVAGPTRGTLPGQTGAGGGDAFMRKYDHSGVEVWTCQFGTVSTDFAYGISVDATGVYVAGYTNGTLPGQASAGDADAFVRAYDHSGAELWTHQFGSASTDFAYGISVDATGVFVAGETRGTLPGQTSAGDADAFVRAYDHSGAELWTHQLGTASADFAYGISVDATGVYVAGYTNGTLPGQTSAGTTDVFVRKYDHSGVELWTRQFGSASSDFAYGISADATGVFVAGFTFGTLPGQSSAGYTDVFVRKYDHSGVELWTRQFGSMDYERAYGFSADAIGVFFGDVGS